VVREIAAKFDYRGPAHDYFRRSVTGACDFFRPSRQLATLSQYHLWRGLTGRGRTRLSDDPDAAELFRQARAAEISQAIERRGIQASESLVKAVIDVPRERYVPPGKELDSWQDAAVALSTDGTATLSAMHAYLVNYALLDLQAGDTLVEVGSGTGYGAALAATLVGPAGNVMSYEIQPDLAAAAERHLRGISNVTVRCADGLAATPQSEWNKAVITCAVPAVPDHYLASLPEGGRLIVPLTSAEHGRQVLTLFTRENGQLRTSEHGAVRYVAASGAAD
jgi:protein-L-isoaspartate(D-aspartate) O-methyltransferase